MCGIAGFIDASSASRLAAGERERVLDAMCQVIRHRGPDDQGVWTNESVALGMRRLSIIDVAGGRQPIQNEDGTLHIVFNGEIYNYRDLHRDLARRGHQFQTHSDTETIIHLYEEQGAACVEELRGMFAFAIWDERKRELFIARDRTGKKPLYYTITKSGAFVFGSELKSLLEHPEVETEISAQALDAYLAFGYVPDPLTIYRRIHKLPPGCRLTFAPDRAGKLRVEPYWDFPYQEPKDETRPLAGTLEELRALLREAVRARLVAEVPLGAFLSGGVDSSAIVALMAEHARETGAERVKTFSIGFNEDSFNELEYARLVAERFDTEHHEFVVTPDIYALVDEIAWHFDEPFADSSAIPTLIVSRLAREHVTVALSGDGGDELFAGYTRYTTQQGRDRFTRLPRTLRQGVLRPLAHHLPHGARGRNFIHNVALDPLDRYIDSLAVFTTLVKQSLYAPGFARQLASDEERFDPPARFRQIAQESSATDALDQLLYLDSKTYLPADVMTKVDRMSMAASLETRAPLLDHKLIEYVVRLPAHLKLHGNEKKYIFKEAMRPLLPTAILDRPKQGFSVPLNHWLNDQLRDRVRDTVLSRRARSRGYFDFKFVELLFNEHERGRRDHSNPLWTLFMLELWHEQFERRAGRATDTPAAKMLCSSEPQTNAVPAD